MVIVQFSFDDGGRNLPAAVGGNARPWNMNTFLDIILDIIDSKIQPFQASLVGGKTIFLYFLIFSLPLWRSGRSKNDPGPHGFL